MTIGEVSHGTPFITINKHNLNRLNINITTHFPLKMGRNTVFDQNLTGMHGSVCVYVWNSSFNGQNV